MKRFLKWWTSDLTRQQICSVWRYRWSGSILLALACFAIQLLTRPAMSHLRAIIEIVVVLSIYWLVLIVFFRIPYTTSIGSVADAKSKLGSHENEREHHKAT